MQYLTPFVSVQLPISARMLLPVARHLQAMALRKEDAYDDPSLHPTVALATEPPRGGRTSTADGARSAAPHAVHSASRHLDATPTPGDSPQRQGKPRHDLRSISASLS